MMLLLLADVLKRFSSPQDVFLLFKRDMPLSLLTLFLLLMQLQLQFVCGVLLGADLVLVARDLLSMTLEIIVHEDGLL